MLLQVLVNVGGNNTVRLSLPVKSITGIQEYIQQASSGPRPGSTRRISGPSNPLNEEMFDQGPATRPPEPRSVNNWTIVMTNNGNQYTVVQSYDEVFALYSKTLAEMP